MTKRTAAEQVAGNRYLLEEILVRLPSKSVTRSKLVSKQWNAHISTTQFVQLHSQHRPSRLHTGMFVTDSSCDCRNTDFMAFNNDLNPSYQPIPSLGFLYDGIKHLDEVSRIKILNSCNGFLLCVVTWSSSSLLSSDYCVCNPTTKTFTLLPKGPVQPSTQCYTAYLAFDPCVSLHYKALISTSRGEGKPLYIYSSEDQSWKTLESPFNPSGLRGFFLKGSIYWLPTSFYCFDVYDEEMKPVQMPPMTNSCYWSYLAVVGSHLYYLERTDDLTPNFRLREMTKDFSEWVTKYDVSISPLLPAFPEIASVFDWQGREVTCCRFSGICVVDSEKEGESQLVLGTPNKLILYNLKEETAKELHTFQGPLVDQQEYRRARVFQFVESLYVV